MILLYDLMLTVASICHAIKQHEAAVIHIAFLFLYKVVSVILMSHLPENSMEIS